MKLLAADIKDIFGTITPPSPIAGFLKNDSTGASAISQFLSNGVVLIYSLAAVVLLFMILWGAFDWMISEGDKEKVASAQKKIINAIIGIILFAVAFAAIAVLGQFTGFSFFVNYTVISRDSQGNITEVKCNNSDKRVYFSKDYSAACQ